MPENKDHSDSFSDFTEDGYRALLALAKRNYRFARFGEPPDGPHLLWRHDIDISMNRALRLARIEREAGVRATYFLYPRSLFYNLLSAPIAAIAAQIIDLGHDIGLHFDPTYYGGDLTRETLLRNIAWEAALVRDLCGRPPLAVSFHLFGVLRVPMPDDEEVAGMVNAYGRTILDDYGYVSDSNGVWRFRRLHDTLEQAAEKRLQVLTHPEWWTPGPMPPRARIQRCIDGYATAMGEFYDRIVDGHGRPNIR